MSPFMAQKRLIEYSNNVYNEKLFDSENSNVTLWEDVKPVIKEKHELEFQSKLNNICTFSGYHDSNVRKKIRTVQNKNRLQG